MKINGNEIAVRTAFTEMLAKSLEVRPCSYNPMEHLELYTDAMGAATSVGLPLPCKRLWFETYCREQNPPLSRKITTELLDKEFRVIETPNGPRFFIMAKADVYIEDNLAGTGYAGYCFPQDEASVSNAIQTVTGMALSKALSNAGFGVVDRGDLISGNPAPSGDGSSNAGTSAVPFQFGEDSPSGNAGGSTAATTSPMQAQMHELFAQLGGQDDELTRAKQHIYPLRGYYAGKHMGELNDSALENLLKRDSTDPSVLSAQAAARLILEDRKKASGKAIR